MRPGEGKFAIDPDSDSWRAVEAWVEARMMTARAGLEAPGVSERDADMERGRITVLRELLLLVAEAPDLGAEISAG